MPEIRDIVIGVLVVGFFLLLLTGSADDVDVNFFAEGNYHNQSGPLVVSIPVFDTYYNISGFSLDIASGFYQSSNVVVVINEGYYLVNFGVSFTGGSGGLYEFELFVNEEDTDTCGTYRSTSNNAIGFTGFSCIYYFEAGDYLSIRVKDQNNPPSDIEIIDFNTNIVSINS